MQAHKVSGTLVRVTRATPNTETQRPMINSDSKKWLEVVQAFNSHLSYEQGTIEGQEVQEANTHASTIKTSNTTTIMVKPWSICQRAKGITRWSVQIHLLTLKLAAESYSISLCVDKVSFTRSSEKY